MAIFRKLFVFILCLILSGCMMSECSFAEKVSVEDMLYAMPAREIIAVECNTGQVLFEKNSCEKTEISHLAKLMLVLLAAEKLKSGELSLTDTVTVSANANSMPAPQIWLDKNEKISAEELLKAITIGNANDAAVALAEHIFGSTDNAVTQMNRKAKLLDMKLTEYADVCGLDSRTVADAADTAKLASELVKYDILTDYFKTWIDRVRSGKAELVNLNRLVRTYKGISGMKACSSSAAGECSVVTASRGDMEVAVVVLGCTDRSMCDDIAQKLLDMSFDMYSLYTPEISEDMLDDIPVEGGEKNSVPVTFGELFPVAVPSGSSGSIDISFEKEDILTAPVESGQICGKLICRNGTETIYTAQLVTNNAVKQKSFKFCLEKLLLYLIKI